MSRLSRWERRTAPVLTGLALLSLFGLVLEAAWDTHVPLITVIDYVAWIAFAADYVIRLRPAPERWRFVRDHPLDLAAVALPVLRTLRVVAAIARVAALSQRGRAERLLVATSAVVGTIVLACAAAALEAERHAPDSNMHSFPDALWWALTTVTTVGYGDRYPTTGEGRIIGGILMIVGIATMGTITAAPHRTATPPRANDIRWNTARHRIRSQQPATAVTTRRCFGHTAGYMRDDR